MKEHEKLNIALVGGGPGCKAIIQMFEMDKFRELRANIIGVADINPEAIGYLYAKQKGFFVTNDYRDFFKMKDLNLIIEITGSKEVLNEIMKSKPENILVMDHISARLFWDFIQVEEERLRIQRKLQKKTEEHKHLFESIAGYVVVIDKDYRIVQMNENFRKDFGDARGKNCFTIFKGRNQKCMPCIVEDTFKDGIPYKSEHTWKLPDGTTGCYTIHSSPIKDENGEVRFVMEMTVDITEKKSLEERLKEYTEGLERLVEERTRDLRMVQEEISKRNIELSALDSIASMSSSLKLEDMLHSTADKVIEVLRADSIGVYLLEKDSGHLQHVHSKGYSEDFFHHKGVIMREVGNGVLGKVAKAGETLILEDLASSQTPYLDVVLKEGLKSAAYIPLISKGKAMGVMRVSSHTSRKFSPNEIEFLTAIGNQIGVAIENARLYEETRKAYEELKSTQEQLIRSEKLASVGKLSATIAHEINNPLAAILTYNKLVSKILNSDSFPTKLIELKRYLFIMEKETARCGDIVKNLLAFSRSARANITDNDINNIVEKVLLILRHDLKLRGINVTTKFARVPMIRCDLVQIQQALMNIIVNASEAMPKGGKLKVTTRTVHENGFVEVGITDTGIGIPEENLPKLFEPFFTTKPEGKGVGLGLSVAYGIIDNHKGSVQVKSKVGKGSTFIVRLPSKETGKLDEKRQEEVSG